MFTKAKAKLIQSLKDKKTRQQHELFVAEGTKIVSELLGSKIIVNTLFATKEWLVVNDTHIDGSIEVIEVNEAQLKQISFLQTPQDVLALCNIPLQTLDNTILNSTLTIALDTIQDPGNLGTIIRIADWYGIKQIVCSPNCADVYNPKVIQATMGSFMRVSVFYIPLEQFFQEINIPVIGAVMNGKNLYTHHLPKEAVLLIGNEGTGISESLLPMISLPITIPKVGMAESLNAGIATAIICDSYTRNRMA